MKHWYNYWLNIAIGFILLISIAMFIYYIINVSTKFSSESNEWGNFGSYLGSITGLLAFAGVLYSIQKNKDVSSEESKRATLESERATFFNLLELHNNIFKSINYNGKTDIEAFKELNSIANVNLNLYLGLYMTKMICGNMNYEKITDIYKQNLKSGSLFSLLQATYNSFNYDQFYYCNPNKSEQFKALIEYAKKGINKIFHKESDYIVGIQTSILNYEEYDKYINEEVIYEGILTVSDLMYKDYGHIYGRYFRNMYYVMDTINNFTDNKNYKELFRAQLSRYELSFGLFNALSSNSSINMVYLLRDYDIFKDIFCEDLSIFKENRNKSLIVNGLLDMYINKH